MIPARILLLTPAEDASELVQILHAAKHNIDILPIHDKAQLLATSIKPHDRLISLFSPVIVPSAILAALTGPAYNIHPGPPEYPGLFPAVHAVMAGATSFGATAHEMTAKVDAGTIIGFNKVDIDAGIDRLNLEAASRILALKLLESMAESLLGDDQALPPLDLSWGSKVYSKADFDNLCTLPADIDATAFALRLRAVGEGPFHRLTVSLHGRTFSLDPLGDNGTSFKGGRPVGNDHN